VSWFSAAADKGGRIEHTDACLVPTARTGFPEALDVLTSRGCRNCYVDDGSGSQEAQLAYSAHLSLPAVPA
jgi:hypothetical protein